MDTGFASTRGRGRSSGLPGDRLGVHFFEPLIADHQVLDVGRLVPPILQLKDWHPDVVRRDEFVVKSVHLPPQAE